MPELVTKWRPMKDGTFSAGLPASVSQIVKQINKYTNNSHTGKGGGFKE